MGNFHNIPSGTPCDKRPSRKPSQKSVPRVRRSSRTQRSRSFRYGSYTTGRQGFRESANYDFTKPAYGSIAIDDGRFFWVAFRRLSDWLNGAEPLDSGFHANEGKAHDLSRAAVRLYLREREALAPLPESFVTASYQRLKDRELMQEQVARYMNVLERDEATISEGRSELELESDDYDLADIDAGALDLDAVEDEAAAA
jgi:hypothetical protein